MKGCVDSPSAGNQELDWQFDPWRERPAKTGLLLLFNLAILAVVYLTFPEKGWTGLAAVLLFGATLSMLVPIRYRLDESGVTVHFLGIRSFRPWAHYRNFYSHGNGIFLTAMARPSALDPFRGHFIFFNRNREQVVAYAGRHIRR